MGTLARAFVDPRTGWDESSFMQAKSDLLHRLLHIAFAAMLVVVLILGAWIATRSVSRRGNESRESWTIRIACVARPGGAGFPSFGWLDSELPPSPVRVAGPASVAIDVLGYECWIALRG